MPQISEDAHAHAAEVAGDRGSVSVEGRHDGGPGRSGDVVALVRVHGHLGDADRDAEVVGDRGVSGNWATAEDTDAIEPCIQHPAALEQGRDPPAELVAEASRRHAGSSDPGRHVDVVLLELGRGPRACVGLAGDPVHESLQPAQHAGETRVVEPRAVHLAEARADPVPRSQVSRHGVLGARRRGGGNGKHRCQGNERGHAAQAQPDHSGGSLREAWGLVSARGRASLRRRGWLGGSDRGRAAAIGPGGAEEC